MSPHQPDDDAVRDVTADAMWHAMSAELERAGRWPDPRRDDDAQLPAQHPMLEFALTRAAIDLGDDVELEQVLRDLAKAMYLEGFVAGCDKAAALGTLTR